jgi:FAD/FMN-containing dehydrogenase
MILADGRRVRCARDENAELFAHAIGGYGLFGVMVEVTLRTVPNVACTSERHVLGLSELGETFRAELTRGAELAFGRLSIEPGPGRFEETLLTVYRRANEPAPALVDPPRDDLARALFRGEVGSDYGKSLRWRAERYLGGEGGERASRNQLMLEPVARFGNRRRDRTDVLFEAFVAPEALAAYARAVRRVVARHESDLLNVTVRHVLEDHDTRLRYAAREVLGLVMLFSQARSRAADERTASMTRALVDAALDHGGRYYLPYRPHATRAQLRRAYPSADAWASAKLSSDPRLRFRNRFWDRYFA